MDRGKRELELEKLIDYLTELDEYIDFSISNWYRAEYALFTLATLFLLIYALAEEGLNLILALVFFLAPGIARLVNFYLKKKKPTWEAPLYNAAHSLIPMVVMIGVYWAFTEELLWEALAWALHIFSDRAFGFGLKVIPSITKYPDD